MRRLPFARSIEYVRRSQTESVLLVITMATALDLIKSVGT